MGKSNFVLPPNQLSIPLALVNLGLGQAGDLLGAVLDLAIGRLEAAENTGAFLDGVVANQLVVCNAVQSAVA
jgi:hypothetical protein